MAQPLGFLVEFLGTMEVASGVPYLTTDISTTFPGATVLIMKSRGTITNPLKVGINKGVPMEIEFNEHASINATATTFTFNQECIIAVCKYVSGAA